MTKPTANEILRAEQLQAQRDVAHMENKVPIAEDKYERALQALDNAKAKKASLERRGEELQKLVADRLKVDPTAAVPEAIRVERQSLRMDIGDATEWIVDCEISVKDAKTIRDGVLAGLAHTKAIALKCDNALLDAVNEEKALEILEILRVMHLKVTELRDSVPTGVHDRINTPLRQISPNVQAALALRSSVDSFNTPIPKLRALMLEGKGI